MQSNVVNRSFFSETLRCFYHIFGYDAVLKELQFIRHLDSNSPCQQSSHVVEQSPPTQSSHVAEQSPPDVTHTFVAPHVSSDLVTVHKISNSVIQPPHNSYDHDSALPSESPPVPRVKYSRSLKPDSHRCVALTSHGERCTLSKSGVSQFCRNHLKSTS